MRAVELARRDDWGERRQELVLGGTVDAVSGGNKHGSTFTVRLPMCAAAAPPPPETPLDAVVPTLRGVSVLVVDRRARGAAWTSHLSRTLASTF